MGQTVILDCCHSCSGTRGGSLDPTAPTLNLNLKARRVPGHVRNFPPNLDKDIWGVVESSRAPPKDRGTKVHSSFVRSGLRSHVLLAACGSQKLAYEQMSTGRGVFTVALLKTLMNIGIHWNRQADVHHSIRSDATFVYRVSAVPNFKLNA